MNQPFFIHEDRVGQVTILPIQSPALLPEISNQGSSEIDNKPGSLPPFDILNQKFMECGFIFFEQVNTGYASHREPLQDTCVFSFDMACFFCRVDDHIVNEIFVDEIRPRDTDQIPQELMEVLLWLGREYGLYINDRDIGESCDLSNRDSILSYITET